LTDRSILLKPKKLSIALNDLHKYRKLDKTTIGTGLQILIEALNAMADYKAQIHKETEACCAMKSLRSRK
jgi:hypothetical protein